VQENNPFYEALTQKKEVCEQVTKASSLSFVVADERMPVQGPRRSQSQRLPTIESISSTTSKTLTGKFSGCVAELPSQSEQKRRRTESLEKTDCGVPNESSKDAGLLSDTEGTWREMSESCFNGFEAQLPLVSGGTADAQEAVPQGFTSYHFSNISEERDSRTLRDKFMDQDEVPDWSKQREGSLLENRPDNVPSMIVGADTVHGAARNDVNDGFSKLGVRNPDKMEDGDASWGSSENSHFRQRVGSHCTDVRGPCSTTEVADTGNMNYAEREERKEIEYKFVCGVPDNVSSWFPIDSKQRGKSEKLEGGSSIKDGLIQSSKLGITVPHKESIQLLFKAKTTESSCQMLNDRYFLSQNRGHWALEAENKNEGNTDTFSCELEISPTNAVGTKTTPDQVSSENKICNECESRSRVDGCGPEKDKVEVTPTANILGNQSFLLKISSVHSLNTDSDKGTLPQATASEDHTIDRNPVIIVACSRKESTVDPRDHAEDKGEDKDVLQQSGFLIELESSINTFSVASGVASVGFLCLKDYNQITKLSTRTKNTPTKSRQGQTTAKKLKQGATGMVDPTRRRSALPRRRSTKKISLQRSASTSKCTKSRLKYEKSEASVAASPMAPQSMSSDVFVDSESTEKPLVPEDHREENYDDGSVSQENKQQTTFEESRKVVRGPDQVTVEPDGLIGISYEWQESPGLPEQRRHDSQSEAQFKDSHQAASSDLLETSAALEEKGKEDIRNSSDVFGRGQRMGLTVPQTTDIKMEELVEEKSDFIEDPEETGTGSFYSAISEHLERANVATEYKYDHDDYQEMNQETNEERAVESLADAPSMQRPRTAESEGAFFEETVSTERMQTRQQETEKTQNRDPMEDGYKREGSTQSIEPKIVIEQGGKVFEMAEEDGVSRDELTQQFSSTDHILTVQRDGERAHVDHHSPGEDKNYESEMIGLNSGSAPVIPWADLPLVPVKQSREKEPKRGNATSERELLSHVPKSKESCKKTRSIPCLSLAEWTSTETSQGSTEFPLPSEISFHETGNLNAKNCDTSFFNQDTSKGRLTSKDKPSCPAADVLGSAVSWGQGKLKSSSCTCQEEIPNLPNQPGSLPSVCLEKQADHHRISGNFTGHCTEVEEDGKTDVEEDSKRAKPDSQDLNYDQKLGPGGECLVLHETVPDSISHSDQSEIKNCGTKQSGREFHERRENAAKHSKTSIQTQSLPSTFNLTGTPKLDTHNLRGYRPPTPRILQRYHLENLLYPWDSTAGVRPLSAGDYTSDSEFTPRQRYLQEGGSVAGESLVAGQVSRVFLHRYRMGKPHITENTGWTMSDSEAQVPLREVSAPLSPLLDLIGAARDLDSPKEHSSFAMSDTAAVLDGKQYSQPELCFEFPEQPSETSVRREICEQSQNEIGFQNPVLDRRKVPVGNSGDAGEADVQRPNEKCGNCGEVIGRGSAYRISQHSNMADMGMSVSQLTTNVYHRDSQTCCEQSSKSSSSYNCRACDCSVNKQTSIEDSSPSVKSPNKRKKRRTQSDHESQSSFASATSASTDFLHTSDFESAEATSNLTGKTYFFKFAYFLSCA